jgi:hypothetical protein
VGYTLSHALDEMAGEQTSFYMDNEDPHLDYGTMAEDVRNKVTIAGTYLVPGIKSPGQMLEGWQVNTAVVMQGALPYSATDSTDDISGTGELLDRWTMSGPGSNFTSSGFGFPCYGVAGSTFAAKSNCTTVASVANMPSVCQTTAAGEQTNPNVPNTGPSSNATGLESLANFGCYVENGAAIVPPAQGTYGTTPRDVLRGKPFNNLDFSAIKNWTLKERYGIQFRAEFFNVFNRTSYALPASNPAVPNTFGLSTATINSAPIIGSGGPRKIQLALKFSF